MFKVKLGIDPVIMNDVFHICKNDYNTRKADEFQSHCVKTVHYGTETVSFLYQYFRMNIKVLLI